MTFVTLHDVTCPNCGAHDYDFFPHDGSFIHACIKCGTEQPSLEADFSDLTCPRCGGLAHNHRHIHVGTADGVARTSSDLFFVLPDAPQRDHSYEAELLSAEPDGSVRATCMDCDHDFTHRPTLTVIPLPLIHLDCEMDDTWDCE
jgi:DNA-directed RNA polymerase subunit RPC12/RpoP